MEERQLIKDAVASCIWGACAASSVIITPTCYRALRNVKGTNELSHRSPRADDSSQREGKRTTTTKETTHA